MFACPQEWVGRSGFFFFFYFLVFHTKSRSVGRENFLKNFFRSAEISVGRLVGKTVQKLVTFLKNIFRSGRNLGRSVGLENFLNTFYFLKNIFRLGDKTRSVGGEQASLYPDQQAILFQSSSLLHDDWRNISSSNISIYISMLYIYGSSHVTFSIYTTNTYIRSFTIPRQQTYYHNIGMYQLHVSGLSLWIMVNGKKIKLVSDESRCWSLTL